mmetsp:Transcript_16935/g.38541  ORF Transcript_16935/g.38541 Transcript_16935/m.38541 type:complete len:218 (+) Transcript_16935:531-1184(+)
MRRVEVLAAKNTAPAEVRLDSMTTIGIAPRETRRRGRRSLTRRRRTTTTGGRIPLPTSLLEEVQSRSISSPLTPRLRTSLWRPFRDQLFLITNRRNQEARLNPHSRMTGQTSATTPSAARRPQQLQVQSPLATSVTIPSRGLIPSPPALLLPRTSQLRISSQMCSRLLLLLLLPPWATGRTRTLDSATSLARILRMSFHLRHRQGSQRGRRTPCHPS